MNRFYNHIKHSVDSNGVFNNIKGPARWRDGKPEANQLDGKQCHTGFDYYEYNIPKFGTPSRVQSSLDRNRINFQEQLENLENDQARHQGINGHGRGETCYTHRLPPGSRHKLALYMCWCVKYSY